ncbi:flagellar hook-associated protein FlgK [Clostridium sp. C2-6-12]|uniref:flagellar hook-associated protein FlgK n=1 Tax=Clostridium sp. C2-6-12 TaxID=2698832 RepID=UPI001371338D|nr:flagellar hook-associated protein FlgK [Clostridium sp. C2-6-12]
MSGLFDTFNVAKRGLNVHQSAINTTSHNIANANTEGYSRQRAVIETTKPFGGMSRFDTSGPGQVGTGAQVTTIQRIRSYFIDYQFRNENGKLGNYNVESNFLTEVEGVFGEPSDTGLQKLFGEFYSAFHEVAKTPEKSSARTVALQKASAIADVLNHTYTQLEKKVTDAQELLQDNVKNVNSYLEQIRELNKQITGVAAIGQSPNDLMDTRDNLIDKVSKMFGITVERADKEAINLKAEGFQATGNVINNLVNSNPADDKYTRLSYIKSAEVEMSTATPPVPTGKITIEYYPLGNTSLAPKQIEVTTTSSNAKSLADSLMQNRILIGDKDGVVSDASGNAITTASADDINKKLFKIYEVNKNGTTAVNSVDPKNIKGEIAGNQSAQNMIKDYMKDLNKIAASIAYSVNAIQTGSTTSGAPAANGKKYSMLFINSSKSTSTASTDDGINAKNITVNPDIIKDVSLLNCEADSTKSGERSGERAQAIADLISKKFNISNVLDDVSMLDRDDFFSQSGAALTDGINITQSNDGKTIDQYYKDMISKLGTQSQEATRRTNSERDSILKDLEDQRQAESGVSLDEEMTNLIQFQHAYQASAKVISTVNELLDVVINGLKR